MSTQKKGLARFPARQAQKEKTEKTAEFDRTVILEGLNVKGFLQAVMAPEDDKLPAGQAIGIVEKTSTGMRRTSCASCTEAAALAARIGSRSDLYFETSTGPTKTKGGRLSASEAVSTGHVRLDVDLASPYRGAGKTLPATEAQTLAALAPLLRLLPPSIVVQTGYGLQVYWAFKEPVDLKDERERLAYARAARRLHDYACDLMRRAGFSPLDNVADLARVMRLPGSFNCKDPANPRPVTAQDHGHRYAGPEDVADALPEVELPPDRFVKAEPASIAGFDREAVRAEAVRKIKLYFDFEAEDEPSPSRRTFTRAWNREPIRVGDHSQSAHDFRLACALARSGMVMPPAELAAAVALFRECCALAFEQRDPRYAQAIRGKATRRSYLARTVGAALATAGDA